MPGPLCPLERDPVSIVQEAGWASGLVWTGMENLTTAGGSKPAEIQPIASCYTDLPRPPNTLLNQEYNKTKKNCDKINGKRKQVEWFGLW
jgi:hypothetical protein